MGRPALLGESAQVGPQREACDRELLLGDVAIDLLQKLIDGARTAARQDVRHPLVATETMGDEGIDHIGDVVHQATVARSE